MKAYLSVTALLFAVLTVMHAWRMIQEPSTRALWMICITVLSAVLCVWAVSLLRAKPESTS